MRLRWRLRKSPETGERGLEEKNVSWRFERSASSLRPETNSIDLSDFLVNMSASADVLAQAKVEIDLAAIPEGKNVSLPGLPHLYGSLPYAAFAYPHSI